MKHRKLLSTLLAASMTISVVGNVAPAVFADTLEDPEEIVATDETSDEDEEVIDDTVEDSEASEDIIENYEAAEEIIGESEVIISEDINADLVEAADITSEESAEQNEATPEIPVEETETQEDVIASEAEVHPAENTEAVIPAEETVPVETENQPAPENNEAPAAPVAEEAQEVKTVETELPLFNEETTVNGILVTVKADRGVFPVGSYIAVTPVNDATADALVDKSRDENVNVAYSMTFDITVYNAEGIEIEPDNSKGNVYVSFKDTRVADNNLDVDVYHITDNKAVELTSEVAEDTVVAVTDSFSYYTVEFTYNSLQYVLEGDSTVALSVILDTVGLEGEATDVAVSDESLFYAYNESGVWYVRANQAFTSNEWMKVTIAGTEYEIVVTDDNNSADTVECYETYNGFDVRSTNPDFSTTFDDGGYATYMSVNGGGRMMFRSNDQFYFDHEYGTGGVTGKLSKTIVGGNAVVITYTVTNTNDEAVTVKIGSAADTEVDGNDECLVSFTTNGIRMKNEDSDSEFYLIPGNGDFTTRWTGAYCNYSSHVYYYEHVFEDGNTYNSGDDSALCYSWTIIVPAGGTVTKTAVFAAGANLTTYEVIFDAASGSGTMDNATFISGIPGSLPACEYTRDEYTFMGWSESVDSATVVYEDQGQITLTANKKLYAVWLPTAMVVTPPSPATGLMYNGNPQALLTIPGSCNHGTVQYSIDSVTWTETIPEKTNAGTYTVYYRGHGDGVHYGDSEPGSFTVTIAPGPNVREDLVYTGEPIQLLDDPDDIPNGYDVEYSIDGGETWTETPPKGTNAGDYEVLVRYTDTTGTQTPSVITGTVTVTIDPAEAPDPETIENDQIPTGINNQTFTGEDLDLVEEPEDTPDNYDKVLYSIDGGKTWTSEIPSTDAAGKYVINVKYVDSTGNHADLMGEDIVVNIAIPKNPTRFGYDFEGWFADEDFTTAFDPASLDGSGTVPAYPNWAEVKYTLIEGNDLTVGGADGDEAIFRAVRNRNETTTFSHHTYVELDAELLNEENYTKKSGSVIIELNPEYVAKLTPGEHTIEIFFDDSYSVKTTFVVNAATTPAELPSTGETVNYRTIAIASTLFAISTAIAIGVVITKKKEEIQ